MSLDPYTYPGTHVLRNRRGLREAEQLARFEARATARRLAELNETPLPGRLDAAHLQAIHHHLFQDVYDWAGQFRTTLLGKAAFVGGPVIHFTPPYLLQPEAERLFDRLARTGFLRGLSAAGFGRQVAQFFAELNRLHPFREGNGRAQRAFVRTLAQQAGHGLEFDVISRERMVEASIRATQGDPGMMERLFAEILDPVRVASLRRAIAFFTAHGFAWNDCYLATTIAGQPYTGKLVGRESSDFMMTGGENRILIGRSANIAPDLQPGDPLSFVAQ